MKFRKIYFIAVLFALIAMLVPTTQTWAGVEGGPPPDWDNVTGPELWGVAIAYCAFDRDNFAAMRVKRVKDCNVKTQAIVDYSEVLSAGCPIDANEYLYIRFDPGTFFPEDTDIPATAKPIITKVKNFKAVVTGTEPNTRTTVSFDAQIKFVDETTTPWQYQDITVRGNSWI